MSGSLLRVVSALVAGLVFGLGLTISGMTDPAKVLNFLDVTGTWDGSLAFVMGGGVIVAFIGYRLSFAAATPLFDSRFHLPTALQIDGRLVSGAAFFGIGWGLAGLCPGPALASLLTGSTGVLVFVGAMVVGMWLGRVYIERSS
jgi:uncharacterized membrane protein YedE/YeeE